MTRREPASRSWLEVRWRQLRNPPPPVLRAVLANMLVSGVGGALVLVYSLFFPQAELLPPVAAFVVLVVAAGSAMTYAWVELPTGASGVRRRSAWASLLGFFAALPITYLVHVLVFQVLEPALRAPR